MSRKTCQVKLAHVEPAYKNKLLRVDVDGIYGTGLKVSDQLVAICD